MKTTTLPLKNSTNRGSSHLAFLLISFALACFALSQARADCQEGCLANENTVLGDDALINNAGGVNNTVIGFNALFSNTVGRDNTAVGDGALLNNAGASDNTATGFAALGNNTIGVNNTANGSGALLSNTLGNANTASGLNALESNTTGIENTAIGNFAGGNNITGNKNTAVGNVALISNTTGSSNIAVGDSAGRNLTTGSNNIDIGNNGVAGESKTIRIGDRGTHRSTFIAGISGVAVAGGVGVIIDSRGHLGTVVSSERFKTEIKPMDNASEAILALKPVTFQYKKELDPEGVPQFGLVAEQVEKVNPDLVARDESGKPYTVRYEAINAMLLNEFIKEHQTVQELKSAALKQEAMIARQQKQIEALTAGLQKVSAQLEADRSSPQSVVNN